MPASLIEYPSNDACLMYLVRHGATERNLQRPPVMQGRGIDEPLAEIGRRQAERLRDALADRSLAAIYSSPLIRAVETAEAAAAPHGRSVVQIDALTEVAVGDWEGRDWPEIERNDPHRYAAFREDPAANGYPGGESLRDLADRVVPALAQLMDRHVGQEILVAAHSVVNRVYLGQLLGMPLAEGHKIAQLNCAINVIRWRGGAAKPLTVNAVHHLM